MSIATAYRGQYVADSVSTASPARLLTMLYDRLVLDLDRADAAIAAADREASSKALLHAQDIVTELHSSLKVDAWSGAAGLAALYDYLLRELVAANVQCSRRKVADCKAVVVPLRDAWHEAARAVQAQASSSLA